VSLIGFYFVEQFLEIEFEKPALY